MTGVEAEIVIAKVLELKVVRDALRKACEKVSLWRLRELHAAADHISLVIDDLEESL